MSEGDLRLHLTPTAEPLECCMDHLMDEDPDFQAFLQPLLVSPQTPQPSAFSNPVFPLGSSPPFSFDAQQGFMPNSVSQNLQQYGLLRSPGATEMRKRKYGLFDSGDVARSLPTPAFCPDYFDLSASPLSTPRAMGSSLSLFGPIRTCKVNANIIADAKQTSSPELGCAMPFSLVKKYPSTDSLSLEDINNRIQKLASSSDAARTPTNSGNSNSTQLTQPSPPNLPRRASRKRL